MHVTIEPQGQRATRLEGCVVLGPVGGLVALGAGGNFTHGAGAYLLAEGLCNKVVTGANVHDVTQIETVLDAIVVKRPSPKQRRHKHLCADAGYRGEKALKVILAHGYIPHVVSRKREADQKKKDPKKKARRWVVEACHGWFNRFRKLLVRYEKLEHTFLALNHLAAAIITLRKIMLPVNIIYG